MSDWQVGDLAVCVDARPNPTITDGGNLKRDCVYRVAGVIIRDRPKPHTVFGSNTVCLVLEGVATSSLSGGFAGQRFRKIRPDEATACEEEFVTLLNRTKRTVSA